MLCIEVNALEETAPLYQKSLPKYAHFELTSAEVVELWRF
jgi:hypothetical protein